MGATARCILFIIAASSAASVGADVDVEGVLVDAKLALASASPINSLRKKGGEGACCVLSMLSEVMRLLRLVHARAHSYDLSICFHGWWWPSASDTDVSDFLEFFRRPADSKSSRRARHLPRKRPWTPSFAQLDYAADDHSASMPSPPKPPSLWQSIH